MTQTYLNQQATTAPFASREASAAGRLRPNAVTGEVDFKFPVTRLARSQALILPSGVGWLGPSALRMSVRFVSLSPKKSIYSSWLKNAFT